MEQATFSEWEHDTKKRRTRREKFLAKRDGLIPWGRLERRVEPFYPKAGRGRRAYPLGTMLRVHCVQLFYNLSDPGMEDLLYEVESVRRFAGLRRTGPLPDETTILNFRHLLERHGLGETLFAEINAHLASLGQRLKTGTIVDASIIDAPSSTKNKQRARDPERHQTKKGKPWYFGRKAHIGVDSESGLTHALATTAANGADVSHAHWALHGGESEVWGDAGYQGVGKRAEHREREVAWHVAMRPGKRRLLDKAGAEEAAEKRKASVRAKPAPAKAGGGAPVPVCEASLRLRQGALSGSGEEYAAHRDAAGLYESADCRPVCNRLTWEWSLRKSPGAPKTPRESPVSAPSWRKNRVPTETGTVEGHTQANACRCSDLPQKLPRRGRASSL